MPAYFTHIIQHCSPSLHGNTLEDSQYSKEDVVKLSDPIVGTDPVSALVTCGTSLHPTGMRRV